MAAETHSTPGTHRLDAEVGAALARHPVASAIADSVLGWPGVSAHPHRFGGIEFRYGRRELGHLHGDRLADLPFPRGVRDELVASGRARVHHVLPDSGWVSRPIAGSDDVPDVVALFRLGYDRAVAAGERRREG